MEVRKLTRQIMVQLGLHTGFLIFDLVYFLLNRIAIIYFKWVKLLLSRLPYTIDLFENAIIVYKRLGDRMLTDHVTDLYAVI